MNISILIPSYNPDDKLISLVKALHKTKISKIVIVNDGSSDKYKSLFHKFSTLKKVTLLHHAINMGKGAALKTGLDYIYCKFPHSRGVITVDADGQHSVRNIFDVADELSREPGSLVLGVRQFDNNVPFRSRFGNVITKFIMKLFFGLNLVDTQTGLRGIPREIIPSFLKIPYNGYEFEIEMLLLSKKLKVVIREVFIATIYFDNNRSSHFNPLIDSMKIYFVLFRYIISSLATALVDYIVFIIAFPFINHIMVNTYMSRFVALFVNYFLVKNLVFYSHKKMLNTFPKYILLVVISGFVSATLIYYFNSSFKINIITAKLIAELLLYFANFLIQKDFIFSEGTDS